MAIWTANSTGFWIVAPLLGLVSIIGIIGNGLVLAIITIARRGGLKSTVQLFLLQLAVSDLFVCVLCIPMTIFSNFHYPTRANPLDIALCKIGRFIQFVSPTISISVLTVISIDRYLSIAKPLLSMSTRMPRIFRAKWLLAFAWLYSTVQFLPTFYFSTLLPINISNTTVYYCTPIPNKGLAGKVYLIVIFLASFVVPVATMSVLYFRVARVVWDRSKKLSVGSTSQNEKSSKIIQGSKKRVIRLLLIVVAVFFGCWTPFVVYSGFLEERLKGFPNPMDGVRLGLYGLGLFNSICNPFIYYFNGGNMNPRVLLEQERRRRSSSASSVLTTTRQRRSLSAINNSPAVLGEHSRGNEPRPRAQSNQSTNFMEGTSPGDEEAAVFPFPISIERGQSKETHL